MKHLKNTVQLIGNLGQDVDFKEFDSGSKRAKFTLATHDYYKDKNGEKVENTQWHNVIAWNNTAKYLSETLKKGDYVLIQGQLTYRKYNDDSGVAKYITEVVANEFIKFTKN